MRALEFADGQSRLARAQLMRSFHFGRYPKILVELYMSLCSGLNSGPWAQSKTPPFFAPILPLVNTIQYCTVRRVYCTNVIYDAK